jgi:hypothetical protein
VEARWYPRVLAVARIVARARAVAGRFCLPLQGPGRYYLRVFAPR